MILYEQIINFISSLIPTRLEVYIGGGVAFVGVLLQHLFGPWSDSFETLLILMVIDYITGISAAYINPNMKAGTALHVKHSLPSASLSTGNAPTVDAKSKKLRKKAISSGFQNIRTGLLNT